jgi:hypothetical protein
MMYRMVASNYPTLPTSVWDRERAKFKAEGKAEGVALAKGQEISRDISYVKDMLQERGITATSEDLHRIETSTDPELLMRWARKAMFATTVAEVFEPNTQSPRSRRPWRRGR